MNDLLQVILLGIIEGITEFLPISSTGHLLLAEQLGLGHRSDLFNIVIQAGAILAVTVIYWDRLWKLATGIHEADNRVYIAKLGVAFLITVVLGLVVKKLGFELPDTIGPIAWALIIGGFWMLAAEWYAGKRPEQAEILWTVAIAVGIGQVVAGVFPGTSRSATTIFAAMLIGGANRAAATEFAFLVGIPTMYAASVYELYGELKGSSGNENWTNVAVGFVVSAVVAFIAVKWLLRYIQTHRFTAFAWYRIVLGAGLLSWAAV
ncbi:undecaprenyl-diphosphate phosphatase [Nevskia sp.]|uniref:undecaprenyl-diphosphate phosphatase n=1 Tax=Nevskia sp. TaxID=1929292 RepID=UPI0025F5234F|nr:undecaprenyl-diphosphate phosphatase [Nevskia sp.]